MNQCVHGSGLLWSPCDHSSWWDVLLSPVGYRCEGDSWSRLLQRHRISTPPHPFCPAAWVTPLHVCGSSNCCRSIRLHINVVSIESTPAPLVALLVCLPVAAVTVEVERARWLRPPQQTYCCPCSYFNIYGSVYLVQALSACTVIKIL